MKRFWLTAGLLLAGVLAGAQEKDATLISYNGSRNYQLVERTDLLRYDNGKYVGLTSREVRSFITNTGSLYDGSFYVLQQTKHNARRVNKGIQDSIPSRFTIDADGQLHMIEDNGFPSFRSFPAFSHTAVSVGDSWHTMAERAVDPLENGAITVIPMYVEYTYLGEQQTETGEAVYVLSAKWATRYGTTFGAYDPDGDPTLVRATGSHQATMHISQQTGNAIVVRDRCDEQFDYQDGTSVRLKGTISLFTKYPPAIDRDRIFPALRSRGIISDGEAESFKEGWLSGGGTGASGTGKTTGGSGNTGTAGSAGTARAHAEGTKGISVTDTASGLMLTMQNLQFKPDSAELLASEAGRLDDIAAILREAPQSLFLVEGHTASTGNPRGEQSLSLERAHAIVNALVQRGIAAEQFICKGSGSTKPVASNATPDGMAKNRRVEITILE